MIHSTRAVDRATREATTAGGLAEPATAVVVGGRYELDGLVGVGGTATVYEARDLLELENCTGPQTLAVKLLHAHLCKSAEARAEFLREAERAASVNHPNLVHVRAWGEHDGGGMTMVWFAMDLVRGLTLDEWVRHYGPLPPEAAVRLMSGVLAALQAAHTAGLVHRDITPQNIVMSDLMPAEDGSPPHSELIVSSSARLLDFGLADVNGTTTLRADGRVAGTARYISPEQAQGLPVRAPADLYQVAAVLYFAVTGLPPFERATALDTMRAHIGAPPPVPSALVPAARPLDHIIARALMKTPAKRHRDAGEFQSELLAAEYELHTARIARTARTAATRGIFRSDGLRQTGAGAETQTTAGSPATTVVPLTTVSPSTTVLPTTTALPASLGYLGDTDWAAEQSTGDVEHVALSESRKLSGGAALTVVIVVILLIAAGAVAAILGIGGSALDAAEPEASEPTPSETAPAPSQPPSEAATPVGPPAPSLIKVPAFVGQDAEAQHLLTAAGLTLGTVHRVESNLAEGTVISQHPSAGTEVASGSAVAITIASGANILPQVTGMDITSATASLETAGFTVAPVQLSTDEQARATVTGSSPGAGAVLKLKVQVTLKIEVAPPPETPENEQNPGPDPSARAVLQRIPPSTNGLRQ